MAGPYVPDDGLDDDDVQGGAPPPVPDDLHEVPGAASREELAALFEAENANPSPSTPEAPARAPAPAAAPAATAAPLGAAAPPPVDDEPELAKLIAGRDANQGVRDDVRAQAERQAQEQAQRIIENAKAEAARIAAAAQAEKDAFWRDLQTKPIETFQGAKLDPKAFIQGVAELDDPRAQEIRALKQQLAEIPKAYDERFKKYDEVISSSQQRAQYEQQQAQEQAQRATESQWVASVKTDLPHMWEKAQRDAEEESILGFPVTAEEVLVRRGHEIGRQISDRITPREELAQGKRRFAPVASMVQYLKHQHAKASAGAAPGGAAQPTTRASGNGSRSLSGPAASERRTTPRAPTADDPNARDEAAAEFDRVMREESAKARR